MHAFKRRIKAIIALKDPFYKALVLRILFLRLGAPGSRTIVIAATGEGSVGDQAMIESFVANVEGPIDLVVNRIGDVDTSSLPADRVVVHALNGLIEGHILNFWRSALRLRRLVVSAKALAVIGADLMDGAYNYRASATRSLIAGAVAKSGRVGQVCGFSWNDAPDRTARRYLRAAGRKGAHLVVRDPDSYRRLSDEGTQGVALGADLAFLGVPARAPWPIDRPDGPYWVVNLSGVIQAKVDQVPGLVACVRLIVERGFRVVLLPHDHRPNSDDLAGNRLLYRALEGMPAVSIIDRPLTVAEVDSVAGEATAVLTGRMHLGILAMRQGVPACVISYQGKVTGLMNLVGLSQYVIDPSSDFDASALAATSGMLDDSDARNRLQAHLPSAFAASQTNFERIRSV